MRSFSLFLKRITDVFGSIIGIIITSPILIITVLLIKITMPGPVFFKQQRAGLYGKVFEIIKFRSMKVDNQAEKKHDITKDADRLTAFGKLIRRLKIDELPQLINVLFGDMSLVGPRPTFKEQVDAYTERQCHRLDMRPGMTGLAQVNGNISLTWEERIEYDLLYVDNYSYWLDIIILIKTVLVVVFGESMFKNPKKEY